MLEWKTPNVGFERLLATKAGRILFDNFLRKEYSSENLQFWIACEKLKSITEENFTNHVDVIFNIYIDPSALEQVFKDFSDNKNVMRDACSTTDTFIDFKLYQIAIEFRPKKCGLAPNSPRTPPPVPRPVLFRRKNVHQFCFSWKHIVESTRIEPFSPRIM